MRPWDYIQWLRENCPQGEKVIENEKESYRILNDLPCNTCHYASFHPDKYGKGTFFPCCRIYVNRRPEDIYRRESDDSYL